MIKVTLYTNTQSCSSPDTKYIFNYNLDTREVLQGSIKEVIYYNKINLQKEIIEEQDIISIGYEIEDLLLIEKIDKAITKGKKSITVSKFTSAGAKFKELLAYNQNKLQKELERIKEKIYEQEEYNGNTINSLTNLKNQIENNSFIKESLTIEDFEILETKIAKANEVRTEFDYKYEDIFAIKQDENNNIFELLLNDGIGKRFYLITNRKNHTKKITDLMTEILTKEGYEIKEEHKKEINNRTFKYYNYDNVLSFNRDMIDEVKALKDKVCKRRYFYFTVYKENNGELEKIL